MESVKKQLLKKIQSLKFKAFTSADFLDIANYKSISKALEQLEDKKEIRRVIRGVYDFPKKSDVFQIEEAPNIEEIANAIARQYNWNICPSGNFALNLIGISTQVPSKYIFVSNGPYRKYLIGKNVLEFKHSTSKEINALPYNILLIIQTFKVLGKDYECNSYEMQKMKNVLKGYEDFIKNNKYNITSWIYEKIFKLID